MDLEKLVAYIRRIGNKAAMRCLGFWMELLEIGGEGLWRKLEDRGTRTYARLDPWGPDEGMRNPRWRLIVNVPEKQLLEWREQTLANLRKEPQSIPLSLEMPITSRSFLTLQHCSAIILTTLPYGGSYEHNQSLSPP